ncbi:DUF4419 domain-containing protein [Kitasatospora sp. NPDC018058]|uniref:DUF4419 domain-containing protein n=1 Tax=Kitasatospora sp. NPDC018058 TaxID=3364025 RepID=UPI0037BE5C59
MIIDIPLGDGQEPGDAAGLEVVGNDGFLAAVVGGEFAVLHRSTGTLLAAEGAPELPEGAPEPTWSLLLRAAHQAFCGHLPLSLSPDVLWYAVVHEVAVHVRLNAGAYEGLFTSTPGEKRTIVVRDDSLLDADPDWARSIRLVREPLAAAIGPELVELFQPTFSTTTPDDVSAALVALMDVVSPYYEFLWISLCGIPRIRLEGTAEDWALLARRVGELAQWFEPLGPWLAELRPVVAEIAATAAGGPVDQEFWGSFYKWRSESGGPYVSGWLTAFFAHTQTMSGPEARTDFRWRGGRTRFTENAFPSHVSKVPFDWQTPAGTSTMAFVGGVLGIERDGEYVRPRLGNAVLRILRAAPDPAAEQARLAAEQLPEGWTVERVREVTGVDCARLLETDLEVERRPGDGGRATLRAVIELHPPLSLIRLDEEWWTALLIRRRGEVCPELRQGPDLEAALRRLHRW